MSFVYELCACIFLFMQQSILLYTFVLTSEISDFSIQCTAAWQAQAQFTMRYHREIWGFISWFFSQKNAIAGMASIVKYIILVQCA